MAQFQTFNILLLTAGSNCACEAVALCYIGLEFAITTKPVPYYYF